MNEYHKIQTVFERDPVTKYSTLLPGKYATPEFAYLQGLQWEYTEKIDGTNIRVMFKPASENQAPAVTFGGKTERAQIPAKLLKHLRKAFPADLMNRIFDSSICLYGEGCGAGIQKGGENHYPDQRFVLFDVRVGDWWLPRIDVEDIAANLRIPVVPVIGHGALAGMVVMAQCGFKSQWGDFRAEGIVARPMVELRTRANERIITKLKCKDFR